MFETSWTGFTGTFKALKTVKKFLLIEMEHITSRPIDSARTNYTSDTVIKFVEDEIIVPFGLPKRVMSDNATDFLAASVQSIIGKTEWSGLPFFHTF